MAEESIVVFLRAQTGEFTNKMRQASGEASAFGAKAGGSFDKVNKIATGVLLGAGAVAVAFGAIAVKSALEGEASHARLAQAIKNTGHAYDDYKEEIEGTVGKMAKFGFTGEQVRDSLATLTTATRSTEKAISLQGLAADIAKARNVDLGTATSILVKVEGGRYAMLGKLLGLSKDQVKAIHSERDAIDLLQKMYGGQAQASAETFAGKIAALKARAHNFTEEVGTALIPQIIRLVDVTMGVVDWFGKANQATGGWLGRLAIGAAGALVLWAAIVKLAQGVMAMSHAIQTAAAAVSLYTEAAAVWAAANPILATGIVGVVIAAGALIASLIILGHRHDEVNKAAKDLTDAVVNEGKTMEEAAQTQLIQFLTAHEALIGVMTDAGIGSGDLADSILGQGDSYEKTIAKLKEYQRGHEDAVDIVAGAKTPIQDLINEIVKEHDAVEAARGSVEAHNFVTGQLATTNKTAEQAADDLAAAQKKEADAVQDLVDALKAQNEQALTAAGADLSLQEATLRVGDAMQDEKEKVLKAIAAKGNDAAANRAAQESHIALQRSILDTVRAAQEDAKAHVDMTSKAKGNALAIQEENAKHLAAKHVLDVLAFTYPGLSGEIQRYRDQLGLIPATKHTDVSLAFGVGAGKGNSAIGTINIGNLRIFGSGGTLGPGERGIVGDAGWEIAEGLPGGGARIISHSQSKSLLGVAGGGGGRGVGPGGNVTIINLTALDAAGAGKTLVRILDHERRTNGGRLPWENN